MGSATGSYGAQEKANCCPGVSLEVLTLLHALTDQERMGEDHDGPHDQLGRIAWLDGLELARRDAVAQDQLGHVANGVLVGRYQLEAAVQSAHVVRRLTGQSDWAAIEQLYESLIAMTGSPVVAINRAIAAAETRGPVAGLAALDLLAGDARLSDYQPYWAARAGLLARTGEIDAADLAYQRAIGLEADPAVRRFLEGRRMELHAPTGP